MGLNMYNSLMAYAQRPALTASERQTAIASIPALKSVLPSEFHGYLDAIGRTIQAKPSVPEQRLDIDRQRAAAAIQQGWARVRQGEARLALAREKAAQGQSKEAWNALKELRLQAEQARDNIRSIDVALGRTIDNIYSGQREYAIQGPERENLIRQRAEMQQRLAELEQAQRQLEQQMLFKQQPNQQPKQQAKQQPQSGWQQTPGGLKFRFK